jgi:hypothetical protein
MSEAGEELNVVQVGKRYVCATCDARVICVKASGGSLRCHGQPMELEAPAQLPATD